MSAPGITEARKAGATASQPGQAGFTLLELVAAMAIFALVAVMGLQALAASLTARDRMRAVAEDSARLTTALSLLRADLDAAAAVAFRPPDGSDAPAFAIIADGLGFAVSLAGQPVLPGEAGAGLGRVEWRLDSANGRLLRRAWPVLAPFSEAAARPETVEMEDVIGLDLQLMTMDGTWLSGRDWGAAPTGFSLPRGVEITLVQRRYDRVRVLVALR